MRGLGSARSHLDAQMSPLHPVGDLPAAPLVGHVPRQSGLRATELSACCGRGEGRVAASEHVRHELLCAHIGGLTPWARRGSAVCAVNGHNQEALRQDFNAETVCKLCNVERIQNAVFWLLTDTEQEVHTPPASNCSFHPPTGSPLSSSHDNQSLAPCRRSWAQKNAINTCSIDVVQLAPC
ncbi:unnamed protein product [Ostreobium quekettii]|uniref:Uncharacterized protein n=1 Tax=Ostreobium quekettii TaxID=121088 RepID=A0A8S1IZC5_9CHLO|nr:unnamed protein product [Ostreobium quekettii]